MAPRKNDYLRNDRKGGGELSLCTVRENVGGSGVESCQDLNALHPTEFRTVTEGTFL